MKTEEFEELALPYLRELYRTALRTIRNHCEAEDVIQETYLQAWRSIHSFTPGTNIRAWLHKILFHVIGHHRRKWARVDKDVVAIDSEAVSQFQLIYDPPISQEIKDEDVLKGIEKMPKQFRAVIVLADVEDYTYKEIATELNIPIGTVMSRLSRGRKLLARELRGFALAYGCRLSSQNQMRI